MDKMFEFATRSKMRFPYKGMVSVEDLWDLPVKELDKVFKTLNAQKKQTQEESLLSTKTKEDEALSTQIDIIKYIVSVKLAEIEANEKAIANKAKKQKIMAIITAKEDEALKDASIEDLQKMLSEIDG